MQARLFNRLISSALFPDEGLLEKLLEGSDPLPRLEGLRASAAKEFGREHPRTLTLDVLLAEIYVVRGAHAKALRRLTQVLRCLQALFLQKLPLENFARVVVAKLLLQQGASLEAQAALPPGFPFAELPLPPVAVLELAALYSALGLGNLTKPILEKCVASDSQGAAKSICKLVLGSGEEDQARKKQLLSEGLRECSSEMVELYSANIDAATKELRDVFANAPESDPAELIELELLVARLNQDAQGSLSLKNRRVDLLIESGKHEEAYLELTQLLAESAAGDPLTYLDNLLRAGELAFALNKPAEAEAILRQAKQRASADPQCKEKAALATHNLGSLLLIQEKPEEARAELETALQLHEQGGEAQGLPMADTLFALGLMHKNQGRDLEAVPYVSRSYSIRLEKLGGDHPLTSRTASLLQQLQGALQDVTAAHDKARDEHLALERARQFVEADNPGEALEILESELKRREAKHHIRHPDLLPVLRLAAEAYEKLGFLLQAKAFRMRVLELEAESPKAPAQ